MRTTLTLEDDVAARLERLRRDRPFKELVHRGKAGSPCCHVDPGPGLRASSWSGDPWRGDIAPRYGQRRPIFDAAYFL